MKKLLYYIKLLWMNKTKNTWRSRMHAYRQAVAEVDFVHDADVFGVAGVVHLGGHPLVAAEQGSGLHDTEDLSVHCLQLQAKTKAESIAEHMWHCIGGTMAA